MSGQRRHRQRSELRGKRRPVQPQVLASNQPVAEGEDVQQPHAHEPPPAVDAERLALGPRLPKHLVDQDVVAVVAVARYGIGCRQLTRECLVERPRGRLTVKWTAGWPTTSCSISSVNVARI